MIGTCQSDRSGGGSLGIDDKKRMKVGSYESIIFDSRFRSVTSSQSDGMREQEKTAVPCPEQQKDYRQWKEIKYDMGGQTKGHNWAPKLSLRYFNFGMGNAHTMYAALVKKYTPERRLNV
eukprot:scaffold6302_cov61-Cyclotella_meneghiniana.AAC.3